MVATSMLFDNSCERYFYPTLTEIKLVMGQAVLCHRVMRVIETAAQESPSLSRETWEILLKFLLAANDSLLSPPSERGKSTVPCLMKG